MKAASVSRETDRAKPCLYERLLQWGAWSTQRRHILERRDELAGDFRLTQDAIERIAINRQSWFPKHIEAIDKAVASLKLEHDGVMMAYLLSEYFLEWKTIEWIAKDENLSEYEVTNSLQRAMRSVARRLPVCEARVKA